MPKLSPSIWSENAPDKAEDNPLVLYRGRRSSDSFAAALSAWLFFEGRGQYVCVDDAAFDVTVAADCSVYALGIHDAELVRLLSQHARRLIVLARESDSTPEGHEPLQEIARGMVHLDPNKSCARVAWDYFHPDQPAPALIRYVEDRALWRWRYPETRSFMARLDTEQQSFSHWSRLLALQSSELMDYLREGSCMVEMFDSLANDIADQAQPIVVAGEVGQAAMSPESFHGAVGEILANRCGTFGLTWYLTKDGQVRVGLRGAAGFDAQAIGRHFGSVGNQHFCSFRIALTLLPSLLAGSLTPAEFAAHSVDDKAPNARQLRREVFFGLWTQAVNAPHYDKNAWRKVHSQLILEGLLD